MNRNVTAARIEGRGIIGHRTSGQSARLFVGEYLVTDYQPNTKNPDQGTIKLRHGGKKTPFETARMELDGVEAIDGQIRMTLPVFNREFKGRTYAKRAARKSS